MRRLLNIAVALDYWPNTSVWNVRRTHNCSGICINAWRFGLWIYSRGNAL